MKRVILFVILSGALVVFLYRFNTERTNVGLKKLDNKHEQKKNKIKQVQDVSKEDKQRVDYYNQTKSRIIVNHAISEYQKTSSLGLKSTILNTLMNFKYDEQEVKNFIRKLISTGDEFESSLVIKNLSYQSGNFAYQTLKEVLLSGREIDDDSYAQVVISLAKNAPEEEKQVFIDKLYTVAPSLDPVAQRSVLKALLDVTKGEERVIKMINKRLDAQSDLSFEMFAMSHLSQYDTTWIDKNRDKFINHRNPAIRSNFIQNLKYYCPRDLWTLMEKFAQDEEKTVREKTLREMVNYGDRALSFLEKSKDKFKLDNNRVERIISTIKKGSFKNNNFCPSL